VQYTDAKRGIDQSLDVHAIVPFSDGAVPVDWDRAEASDLRPDALSSTPTGPGEFAAPPPAALSSKSYAAWEKDFEQWVSRTQALKLMSAPALKLTSKAGESERDFQIRLQQSARELRDAAVQKLRAQYAPKVQRLADKLQTAQDALGREQQQAQQQKLQSAVSIGATLLGALMGRKAVSMSTLGRATTAARGVGRAMKESEDISKADDRVKSAQTELSALESELASDVAQIESETTASVPVESIDIKPKRGAIDVRLVALVWKPEEKSRG
jgi:hypothetical protein